MSHKDALGSSIVIDRVYGYSTTANGVGHVVICKAKKLTGTAKVSVEVLSRKKFLYGKALKPSAYDSTSTNASVHAYNLFPLPEWALAEDTLVTEAVNA